MGGAEASREKGAEREPREASGAAAEAANWSAEHQRLMGERAMILLLSAAVLYPAFWFLDRLTVPLHAPLFAWIRAAVVAVFVVGLAAIRTPRGDRFAGAAAAAAIYAASTGISIMTMTLEGFRSEYYVGNMIVLFVMGFFMPWGARDCAVLGLATILTYVGVNLAGHGPGREMISPIFFLGGTTAFATIATVANEQTRRREWALRADVERANAHLKGLDEQKTRFFANVSHELRTPLQLILAPLDVLLGEERDAERRGLLDAMGANARRLLRQVNTLLEVAKVEAGRLRLELSDVQVGDVLRELIGAAAPHARRRGLGLFSEGLDALPVARYDREKIETIAANLLSNALKFTPPGGRVVVRAGLAGDARLFFEFEDTGPGIPQEAQERLFERFYQVDGGASRAAEGTGLGLALVRELARLHEGAVSLRSEVGRGSTFRVELPLVIQEPKIERRKAARRREDQLAAMRLDAIAAVEYESARRRDTLLADVAGPAIDAPPVEPGAIDDAVAAPAAALPPDAAHVLLVEDNADLRAFVAARLAKRYRVSVAADGVEGLELARKAVPDVIVSDVMMPRMDGLEMCRRIRQEPELAQVPVILATAKAGTDALCGGLEVGASDYVTKPFEMRELVARLEAHLRARRLERALADRDARLAAVGRMTATIVHDLRSPLTSIFGHAELALDGARSGAPGVEVAEDIRPIVDASQRIADMVEEVLIFSRGDKVAVARDPVPLRAFLEGALASMAQASRREGVALETAIDLRPDAIAGLHAGRMTRAIENLVKNAREATQAVRRERAPRVRVTAAETDDGFRIRISDNGPGIPPELSGRLFRQFATAGKKGGTGLGLATVKAIVEGHGGTIAVEERGEDGGAAFEIKLPRFHAASGGGTRAAGSVSGAA